MHFTKMHGCGNDYVYVDVTKTPLENAPAIAVKVSDRHKGIGSDGLILIAPSDKADFRMIMYNLDGSLGAMCGNGIRCVGKYVYDHHLTDRTSIRVETGSGIKQLQLNVEDGRVKTVRVDMGEPILEASRIPAVPDETCDFAPEAALIDSPISVQGKLYRMTAVSMGNPHCVIFMEEDPMTLDLEAIGPHFENHRRFPDRINTEFIQVVDEHHMRMRVWERGSGETMACGTGACASAVAGIINGRVKSPVTVGLRGGELVIAWAGEGHPVYMTGPAEEVFEGDFYVQD